MIRSAAGLILLAAAALAAASPTAAQPATPTSAPPAPATDWRAVDPASALLIETTKGRIVVELAPAIAPLAVARIKTLTRRGYYDGALFYRVIKDYMAQTGDKGARTFRSDLPNLKAEFTFRRTAATPYVSVGGVAGGDLGFVGATPVQVGADGEGWALYCPGVAAMPHYDDPNTANSQFFLMRRWAPSLEKTFTVWGRVVLGLDVVRAIENGEPPPHPDRMTRVRVLADVPAAERPEVKVLDPGGQAFARLLQQTMQARGPNFSLCDLDLTGSAP